MQKYLVVLYLMCSIASMSNWDEATNFSETKIQTDSFVWFNNAYPELRGLLYHVPNGEVRDKITASRLTGLGVVAGIPDIVFHYRAKTWFFEFKSLKGVVSDNQKAIHSAMREQGFTVFIIRSVAGFVETIEPIIKDNQTNPLHCGLTKDQYYYRHGIFDWLYTGGLRHGELIELDTFVAPETKHKFIEIVREFIGRGYDTLAGFEILFTEDSGAIYRKDVGGPDVPILYKGQSVVK